ncbi:MAG: hypothetical protein EPO03_01230 [Porticoccaceae bacterium]|nr:MAG: hypothetical protein EPO03_01230 [Porticoccaceae bacterium]
MSEVLRAESVTRVRPGPAPVKAEQSGYCSGGSAHDSASRELAVDWLGTGAYVPRAPIPAVYSPPTGASTRMQTGAGIQQQNSSAGAHCVARATFSEVLWSGQ